LKNNYYVTYSKQSKGRKNSGPGSERKDRFLFMIWEKLTF
jgi:hypothetical protein